MNNVFELKQKDVVLTAALAEAIEVRSMKLGRFCGRIQRCTITVEGPGKHHRQGVYRVRIDLVVPGAELVVHKHAEANLEIALKAAFQAMGRVLEDQVSRSRGFVKSHQAG